AERLHALGRGLSHLRDYSLIHSPRGRCGRYRVAACVVVRRRTRRPGAQTPGAALAARFILWIQMPAVRTFHIGLQPVCLPGSFFRWYVCDWPLPLTSIHCPLLYVP